MDEDNRRPVPDPIIEQFTYLQTETPLPGPSSTPDSRLTYQHGSQFPEISRSKLANVVARELRNKEDTSRIFVRSFVFLDEILKLSFKSVGTTCSPSEHNKRYGHFAAESIDSSDYGHLTDRRVVAENGFNLNRRHFVPCRANEVVKSTEVLHVAPIIDGNHVVHQDPSV
jgi:hypothetical protein